MSKSETKVFEKCIVCAQEIADPPNARFCSRKCEYGHERVGVLKTDITNFVRNPDPRRFYYDVGFGELCDKFTILLLRKIHQQSSAEQLETNFYIEQVLQSIFTKLNKCYFDKSSLANIGRMVETLYIINASMWRARSAICSGRGTDTDTKLYFDLGSKQRDNYKSQLDAMVDGRARLVRIYE